MRRGSEFSIKLGQNELMNSRLSGSEESLATIACEKIRDRKEQRVLIGGLGMGFTLRAALAALGPNARITVAELVPAVFVLGRGPLGKKFWSFFSHSRGPHPKNHRPPLVLFQPPNLPWLFFSFCKRPP